MDTVLQAVTVGKVFGNRQTGTSALRDITLSIEQGSFCAVIGKSGSGKSTLLRVLSGLDKPSEGLVLLEGKDIHGLSEDELCVMRRRRIGFVFQNFNLFPEFTVEENIKMPLFFDEAEPDEQYISSIIDVLGLSEHKNKLPQQLSGGEAQRTAIARAFASKPAIVFADEPTGNLDSVTSGEVLDFFLLTRRMLGQTLLMVTHDLEIAGQADRILTLKDGALTEDRRRGDS